MNYFIKSNFIFYLLLLFCCCKQQQKQITQYFSVKINGKVWTAPPAYNINYKAISHQLSILAVAKDGSRFEISFHAINQLKKGKYPSTLNDNGILSGVFYFPANKITSNGFASVNYNHPIQENAIQLTRLEKIDQKTYLIEGNFSPIMYAVSVKNPVSNNKLTEGKFRVIFVSDIIGEAL